MNKAIKLAHESKDDWEAIRYIGQGRVAEETLAIAAYCSIKYANDFTKAVTVSVNHSGDSDSTGAVTGNIMGAYLGLSAIEDKYIAHLELVSDGVADTSELFMRSYQMYKMFARKDSSEKSRQQENMSSSRQKEKLNFSNISDSYDELKIGQLANIVLRRMLEDGCASEDEIQNLQEAEYCKTYFDIQYPLLVREERKYERVRYYKTPLLINNLRYVMCSQWFEVEANNDRPYLIKWIEKHSK